MCLFCLKKVPTITLTASIIFISKNIWVPNIALWILAFPNFIFSCHLVSASSLATWSPSYLHISEMSSQQHLLSELHKSSETSPHHSHLLWNQVISFFCYSFLFRCGWVLSHPSAMGTSRVSSEGILTLLLAHTHCQPKGYPPLAIQSHGLSRSIALWDNFLILLHLTNGVSQWQGIW